MELIEGGDLKHYLESNENLPLPLNVIKPIIRQMAKALRYLDKKGIIHRNMKPDNIILTIKNLDDPDCKAKLTDFGSAETVG